MLICRCRGRFGYDVSSSASDVPECIQLLPFHSCEGLFGPDICHLICNLKAKAERALSPIPSKAAYRPLLCLLVLHCFWRSDYEGSSCTAIRILMGRPICISHGCQLLHHQKHLLGTPSLIGARPFLESISFSRPLSLFS